jgi:beta-lactam-binding protein with PASTA domain
MRRLVILLLASAGATAVGDDFQMALDQAKGKIFQYRLAKNSGDPVAIRQATLKLQEDPLAIRRVNRNSPEAFKIELNKDIANVQQDTRELIRNRFEYLGISRERVSFFEATNPTKAGEPVKVGQDWDMTVRVDGRDVPTRISQPIAHEAYYQAATGRQPPPATATDPVSQAARKSFREAANRYAEQQSLAVTDYQYREAYGGSPTEGTRIIMGPKDARLRDPVQMSQVIEYKSNEARNLAAELREHNRFGSAVGRDIEEMRQSKKQFENQVKPRVEAMGGQVPQFIVKGQEILKQVDAGKLTPNQAREQLAAMGETPSSFIRKTAQLVEAAQVLQDPARRGPAAPDVFQENVMNRLANRRLMRILDQVEAGTLTLEQAREQVRQLEANLPRPAEGVLTAARRQGGNALMGLWIVSAAGEAGAEEGVRAAQAGEDPDRMRAAGNAMLEATMIPGIIRGYQQGQQVGREELAKARMEGRSTGDAAMSAYGRLAGDLTFWNIGSRIAEEEIADEEARAAAEGREPNYWISSRDGAVRGLGEVLMVNSIARSAYSVTEEEVIQIGQDQVFRAWLQGKMLENVRIMNGIRRDLEAFAFTVALDDPEFAAKLAELTRRYQNARLAMANLSGAAARQLGEQDALAADVRWRASEMPDPPTAEAIIAARKAQMVGVPDVIGKDFSSAQGVIASAGLLPQPAEADKKPESVKPMMVFAQEPGAGTLVDFDTPVTFIYSSGKMVAKTVKVPPLAGLTKEAAEAKLAELKLKAEGKPGKEKPPRNAKKQQVYAQSPQEGTEVAEEAAVAFEFYAGIPVGRYEGLKKQEAEARIKTDDLLPVLTEGELTAKNEADEHRVFKQSPAPGEYVWFDEPVEVWYYRLGSGFQDGDGASVDPRFADAKVSDGDETTPGGSTASAGKRTQISYQLGGNPSAGAIQKSIGWIIRRYPSGDEPRKAIAAMHRDGFLTVPDTSAPGFKITSKDRQVGPDVAIGTLDSQTPQGSFSSHVTLVVYRDEFLISFTHMEPTSGYDYSREAASILKKSKELIDRRFPKP